MQHARNNLRVAHMADLKNARAKRVKALIQETKFCRDSTGIHMLFSTTVRDRVFETGKVLSH